MIGMLSDMRITFAFSHEELETDWREVLPCATEKGYPSVFDKMIYWVLWVGDKAIAYTGSLRIGDFAFVGNTYVRKEWRSRGLHKLLLNERNKSDLLRIIPKVTIINPIEGVSMQRLESVVLSLGYTKVCDYADVGDIMARRVYEDIGHHNIWRLNSDSRENEEE